MENKKLTRSRTDKFLGGVCGGLGAYFGIDPGIVRIVTVLAAVFTQIGWVIYLVLWAILPLEGSDRTGFDEAKDLFNTNRPTDSNPDDYR